MRDKSSLSRDEKRDAELFLERHGVVAFPTVLVLDSKGFEVEKVYGYDRKGAHIFVRNLSEALGLDT